MSYVVMKNTLFSWLTRLLVLLVAILALVAGIVLSALFFALFLALALVGAGWLWWRHRRLWRQASRGQAEFIETEYEVLKEYHPKEPEPPSKRLKDRPR